MSWFFLLLNLECVFVSSPDKHIKDFELNKIKQNFETPFPPNLWDENFQMDSSQHFRQKQNVGGIVLQIGENQAGTIFCGTTLGKLDVRLPSTNYETHRGNSFTISILCNCSRKETASQESRIHIGVTEA